MTDKSRTRIWLSCVLLAVSLLGGLIGEALFLTFTFLKNHGCLPLVSSLWCNAVWVEGFTLFLPASFGLLILLIYHVAAYPMLFRCVLIQFLCSILFTITSGLSWWVMRATIPSMTGGAVVAFVIAVTLVLVERNISQNKRVLGTA